MYLVIYLVGCVGSLLRHAGFSLWHAGSFISAREVLSSCGVQVFSSLVVARRFQSAQAL